MRRAAICWAALAALVSGACSSKGGGDPPDAGAGAESLVIGLQGEQVVNLIAQVHLTATVDGQTAVDATMDLKSLPREIVLTPPAGKTNAVVLVHVEGTNGATGTAAETLARDVVTGFVAGEKRLLRVQLEAHCLSTPLFPVTCPGGQTCLAGRCQDTTVTPDQLEPYDPSWATDAPDACRTTGHGDPTVTAGTGQSDFLPITEGETLQAERGPQGGHHIWVAVRMKNLKQSGSTTTITGVQPGTGTSIPPTAFVFTFTPDDGGYCKLWGLRYQLDNGGIDYHQFLGKPLDLTVTVNDTTGASAAQTVHINVDPTVLGETTP